MPVCSPNDAVSANGTGGVDSVGFGQGARVLRGDDDTPEGAEAAAIPKNIVLGTDTDMLQLPQTDSGIEPGRLLSCMPAKEQQCA